MRNLSIDNNNISVSENKNRLYRTTSSINLKFTQMEKNLLYELIKFLNCDKDILLVYLKNV